jgi:peptide/nickel transport system permease protein
MTVAAQTAIVQPRRRQRLADNLRVIFSSRVAVVGLVIVLFWVVVAIAAPVFTSYDPSKDQDYKALDQGPSSRHILGTDHLGRDVWSRLAYGARTILLLGPLSVAVAFLIGMALGLPAAYYGGWLDEVIMRGVDVLLAFPSFVLAIILVAVLGDSVPNVLIAVTIGFLPYFVRLTRVEVLRERELEYVTAARVVGNSRPRIALKHLLPNVVGPSLVQATLVSGWAILNASGLAFLGIGIRPPTPEWGVMVAEGANDIITGQWWTSLVPGAMILVAVMAFHLVGDDLRGKQW